MSEKTPLENLMEQMGQLLKLVNEATVKGVNEDAITYDIVNRMNQLEKQVDLFTKQGEEIVAQSGLSTVELRKYQEGSSEEIAPEGKELMDKVKQLQKEAKALEASYKTGLPSETPKKEMPDDPKFGKHRRKKFKRFGGDDKWKPL